jgi:hypothetical protein
MSDILYAETSPVKGRANNNLPGAQPPVLQKPPLTMAGAYLCRRFCIDPVIADLVASLAGLGPNQRAA